MKCILAVMKYIWEVESLWFDMLYLYKTILNRIMVMYGNIRAL